MRSSNLSRRAVQTLAVLGASTLVLAGCSGESDGGDDTAGYPEKDITLVVPYDAGGASDLAARTLASEMESELGVSIVVENRSGGAGSVGLSYVADAEPDGYTLGYMPVETVMLGHQGYDIDPENYDYLGQIVGVPATIAVPADSPYETLEDLVQAATDEPDSITVANSGAGSIWEATTTAINEATGATFRPVPFDGGAPAVTAAVGGQVDAVVAGISETSQGHADGQLRVLAVFTEEPVEALPDVPTAQEAGVDVLFGGWGLLGAPTGLPDEVVTALDEAVKVAVASEGYTEVIESAGNVPEWRNAADSEAFVTAETERFAGLLAE